MKQGYYFLFFLVSLSAIISNCCCCASNDNLLLKRAYEENPSSSSHSSSGLEHDSLTPIEDTDSAPSDHGRTFSRGSPGYHEKMYGFHHAKVKYHKVFGEAYDRRNYKKEAEKHYAESSSSKQKKLKHKKLYKGLLEENLKPGVKTARKDAIKKKDFPKAPTLGEAMEKLRHSDTEFERRKGHHYLVEKKQVVQKDRISASEKGKGIAIDPVHDQKTTEKKKVTHTYTLTPIYAQRARGGKVIVHTTIPTYDQSTTTREQKQVNEKPVIQTTSPPAHVQSTTEKKQVHQQAVHTLVPSTTSTLRSPVKQDSTKDLITFPTQDYYRSRNSQKVRKRLPVQKLGGGKSNSPSTSDHSSEGNYLGDPLLKWIFDKPKKS